MRSTTFDAALAIDESDAPFRPRWTPCGWESLSVDCAARTRYEVRFGRSLIESEALAAAVGDRKALLVTTPTVHRHHGAAIAAALRGTNTVATLVLKAREETKCFEQVEAICAEALSHGMDRRGLLISFGGGVCSDLVTVAGSLIRRGIGHIRVPTTLIGQIDAGIALKGAVNFAGKKSFLGCFHPPEQVLIDPAFLRSLPRRFLVAGLAEAIKMGIVRDGRLFELVESRGPHLVMSGFDAPAADGRELLQRSISAMLDELRSNPYEDQGYERVVDFGHTFSPALEAALGFEIQHGEAVAIDIALSSAIAKTLGWIDAGVWQRIVNTLRMVSLPVSSDRLDVQLCRNALVEARRHRGGSVNLVIPAGIGRATFLKGLSDVPDTVLQEALALLAKEGTGNA